MHALRATKTIRCVPGGGGAFGTFVLQKMCFCPQIYGRKLTFLPQKVLLSPKFGGHKYLFGREKYFAEGVAGGGQKVLG